MGILLSVEIVGLHITSSESLLVINSNHLLPNIGSNRSQKWPSRYRILLIRNNWRSNKKRANFCSLTIPTKMRQFSVVSIVSLFALSHAFTIQPLIINGDISNPADFPFYVLLRDGHSRCGASLISDR